MLYCIVFPFNIFFTDFIVIMVYYVFDLVDSSMFHFCPHSLQFFNIAYN